MNERLAPLYHKGLIVDGIHALAREYMDRPSHKPGSLRRFIRRHVLDRKEFIKALADLRDITRKGDL